MAWHEQVDSTLAAVSLWEHTPSDLCIDESLRTTLKGIEDPSMVNHRTLRAAQAMAECAIHPMATGLAHTIGNGIIARLTGLDKMWRGRGISDNTEVYKTLHRVSQYYLPNAGWMRPHEIGSALHAASELMTYAYPVTPGWLCNPNARPTQGNIVQAVGLFAVTSQVYRDVCGRESHQTAMEDLVQNMQAIA